MAGIKIADLHKSFGAVNILRGIDLEIKDGEFVCFLGPSGCGKSTLLRSIAGLEDLSSGSVVLGDRDISDLPSAKRDIAMVFQNYALYPHMNVRKNMSFGMSLSGMAKPEIERRVMEAAEILRITELLERKPKQLSGGQRQRVAIGRAIVRKPKLFLLDEPLSNLDAGLRVTMRAELAALHRRLGVTMIHVTHDQVEAMTLSDRVVVLHQGKVSQFGSPLELFHRPANLFVAGFVGSPKMNFIPAKIIGQDHASVTVTAHGMSGTLNVALEAGFSTSIAPDVTLGIRPERLQVVLEGQGAGGLSGTVRLMERLGTESHIHIETDDGGSLVAITGGSHPARMADRVHVSIPSADTHLFDAEGIALPRILDAATKKLLN